MSDQNVESVSTEMLSEIEEEEQAISSPCLPMYIKNYSQTQMKSTVLEHIWKIDKFKYIFETMDMIKSPAFPETNQYVIQMNILRPTRSNSNSPSKLKLYILTSEAFNGSCTTVITRLPETFLLSKSISGRITDMTLLIETFTSDLQFEYTSAIVIHCTFEIFHCLENKTICMNLLPPSTVFSKDVSYLEDSTIDEQLNDEESIKFIVGQEKYAISKKLLCATNSSYFKNICLEEKEKDMTEVLTIDVELQTFKQILLYILTGSVKQYGYNMLKQLLTAADKYDVLSLKLTCEHYLLHYLNIENAVELMQLAFLCNAKFLEMHSINFIKFHTKEERNEY